MKYIMIDNDDHRFKGKLFVEKRKWENDSPSSGLWQLTEDKSKAFIFDTKIKKDRDFIKFIKQMRPSYVFEKVKEKNEIK